MKRALWVMLLLPLGQQSGLRAQDLSPAYSSELLVELRDRYHGPLVENIEQVLLPLLNARDQQAIHGYRLELPLTHPDDPLAYEAGGDPPIIRLSVRSLKFLDDIAVAAAWLETAGVTAERLTDYLGMLKYGALAESRPTPQSALGVPPAAQLPSEVDEYAKRLFSSAAVFILAHELGHIRLHGGADAALPFELQRAQEVQADSFAIELFRRMRTPPLGAALFFHAATLLGPHRGDFPSEAAWQAYVQSYSTHPTSASRLRRMAESLRADACAFTPPLTDCTRLLVDRIATDLASYAVLLDELEVHQMFALRGATLRPEDLRVSGSNAQPLPAQPSRFHGEYSGRITKSADIPVNLAIACEDGWCLGKFDSGLGEATIGGRPDGTTLRFRWSMEGSTGSGVFRIVSADELRGSWGFGAADTGLGIWTLLRLR